jgi:hypothetical protein
MRRYVELLKDPRWQKKRLKILERDNWKCVHCEGENVTLHIHHLHYSHNTDPWEYEDVSLVTLCEACHQAERECKSIVEDELLSLLALGGFLSENIDVLCQLLIHGGIQVSKDLPQDCGGLECEKKLKKITDHFFHNIPVGI